MYIEEIHMMFSGGEGVKSKVVHDVLSLRIKKTKIFFCIKTYTYYQGNRICIHTPSVVFCKYAASTERLEQICTHSSTECMFN